MNRKDFEIMAPVGSRESLAAAFSAGADSIYFGIESLNMRSHSSANFTIDDLYDIANQCRERGVKSYLTVNTVVYDDDIELLHRIIDAAKAAGISAIISADMAAIGYARRIGQSVHISTQVNVANIDAVEFYSQFADVMVLARELNMNQVGKISAQIKERGIKGPEGEDVRLEMFCHGALCMAVSGKCYMSLHQMNSSANRGACNQICRRRYLVKDADTGDELSVDGRYIMSPKDLKTIHFLNKMVDAGVRVFKIEGRARGAEYVKTVVECYNEALCSIVEGSYTQQKIDLWDSRLRKVFNRGFWDGYYLGQRLGEWSMNYGSSAERVKVYAARTVRYFPKIGVGEFKLESGSIVKGDELLIIGPTTGVVELTADEMRVDLKVVDRVEKGQHFSIAVGSKVRAADRLYVWRKTEAADRE